MSSFICGIKLRETGYDTRNGVTGFQPIMVIDNSYMVAQVFAIVQIPNQSSFPACPNSRIPNDQVIPSIPCNAQTPKFMIPNS